MEQTADVNSFLAAGADASTSQWLTTGRKGRLGLHHSDPAEYFLSMAISRFCSINFKINWKIYTSLAKTKQKKPPKDFKWRLFRRLWSISIVPVVTCFTNSQYHLLGQLIYILKYKKKSWKSEKFKCHQRVTSNLES